MAVKVTDSIRQDRMVVNNDERFGIQKYDIDNAYPQRIKDIIDGSGTLSLCVKLTAKFLIGQGFVDLALNKIIVDKKGTNLYKLLNFVAKEYAPHNGFALHFNYNALFQITEISILNFDFCRLAIPNDEDEVKKIAVYNDWDKRKKRTIKAEDIQFFDIFNPNPEKIQEQVNIAGGWDKWTGQILYFSDIIGTYPKSVFHSRLKDAVTENEIMTYKFSSTVNGFAAPHLLFYYGEFESDEERKGFIDGINSNQGGENAGNVVLVDGIPKDMKPDLETVSTQDIDKRFEATEISISNNLRKQFLIPPVLIGDLVAGKLGTSQEISDAINFFNGVTTEQRENISEVFKQIFAHFKTPIFNEFTINKLANFS